MGQLFHHRVLVGIHKNRVFEEIAEQHGRDGHETDHHRRNGQQYQRHCHHPRRLVRRVVFSMTMIVMGVGVVCIGILVVTLFAVEDQEVHAERIKRRDKHARQHREMGEASGRQMALGHSLNDAVFGIETGKKRRTDQGQGAQQRSDPGDRHVLAHAAHPADVLVVVHAHDDRACAQEQQRFEESVRHQVEHRHRVGRCAQGHRHVTELGQRGISHHAFDVILDDAQKAHEQGGDGADHHDEVQSRV